MQPRTRHQETVDAVAGWIVGGVYPARAVLPREDEIGDRLGVSRTVVREAMRTLAAKGLVSVRRRHGTQVLPAEHWSLFDAEVADWRLRGGLDRAFVDDLVRFRMCFEPFAAGLAAENFDFPAGDLDAALARMEAAVDGRGDYHAADLAFHETILEGSDNQFLRQLAPLLRNALRISIRLSVISMDTARASLPMHRAVAAAIAGHDPAAAQAALTKLIGSAREDILVVLSRDNGELAYAKGARVPDPRG